MEPNMAFLLSYSTQNVALSTEFVKYLFMCIITVR